MSNFEFDTAYSAITGEHVPGLYTPHAEESGDWDILLDGNVMRNRYSGSPEGAPKWNALIGHTRQYGYRGAIMHPSETADDDTIREWVREAGGDVFALVVVDSPCECERPGIDDDCFQCDGSDTSPAGWAIIYREAP